MNAPNKEGVWLWTTDNCYQKYNLMNERSVVCYKESIEIDVYEVPNGTLCIWGPDFGYCPDVQDFWDTDEMCGHLPAHIQGGEWEFIKEF